MYLISKSPCYVMGRNIWCSGSIWIFFSRHYPAKLHFRGMSNGYNMQRHEVQDIKLWRYVSLEPFLFIFCSICCSGSNPLNLSLSSWESKLHSLLLKSLQTQLIILLLTSMTMIAMTRYQSLLRKDQPGKGLSWMYLTHLQQRVLMEVFCKCKTKLAFPKLMGRATKMLRKWASKWMERWLQSWFIPICLHIRMFCLV